MERPRLRRAARTRADGAGHARLRARGQRQDRAAVLGARAGTPGIASRGSRSSRATTIPARLWDAVLTVARARRRGAGRLGAGRAGPAGARVARARSCRCSSTRSPSSPQPVILVLDDVHVLRSRECLNDLGFLVLHAPGHAAARAQRARRPGAAAARAARARAAGRDPRGGPRVHRGRGGGAARRARARRWRPSWWRALCARTEGWGAGLRLAALSLQGRDDPERFVAEFAGDDRVVGDYLLAEVLDRQPPRLRAFLLRTSIVERICGDLADALTGQGSSSDTLADLERTNGFVLGVDSRREWFRYHRLFAKLLRTRARARAGGRAAGAARARRALVRRARDGLGGARARRRGGGVGPRGRARRRALVRPLRARPGRRDPRARRRAAAGAAASPTPSSPPRSRARRSRSATPRRPRRTSRTRATPPSALPAERRRRYLETMALARLYRARLEGDFEAALDAADELLAEAAVHGGWSDDARQALVHAQLGRTALWAHRLDRARAELEQGGHARRAPTGLDYVAVSALSALGAARRDGARAGRRRRAPARRSSWPSSAAGRRSRRRRARTRRSRSPRSTTCGPERGGGASRARAATPSATAARATSSSCSPTSRARMAGAAGRARATACACSTTFEVTHRRGHAAARTSARRWPHARAAATPARATSTRPRAALEPRPRRAAGSTSQVTAARLRAGRRRPGRRASRSSPHAEPRRGVHSRRRRRARGARGDRARERRRARPRGRGARARARRSPSAPATAGRSSRAGGASRRCCAGRSATGTAHRAIAGELLLAFEDRDDERRTVAPLLEPLSERERAILRYLPTTLSNREIAAELFVTTNTVKTHLRSIYRKLDVARRREAVERARDLRLLSARRR